MSIYSNCTLTASTSEETTSAGRYLAFSLYRKNLTILLTGDLGVGKTTFAKGFALGLGVKDRIVSPTYALEQRYEQFTHIDLYRLTKYQAEEFLHQSEGIEGIRMIEWAERIDQKEIGPHIHVHIDDKNGTRSIRYEFLDEAVPGDDEINKWIRDVCLPPNVVRHVEKVTEVADKFARMLVESGRMPIRLQALHAAARTHDLLRFVDFKTWEGDPEHTPSDHERKTWERLKKQCGTPHEEAARKFLVDRGYEAIGEIVRTHRGIDDLELENAKTNEQKILAYADKRVAFDQPVTLDERFADFVKRYGNGKVSDRHKKWLSIMQKIECDLFLDGPPKT